MEKAVILFIFTVFISCFTAFSQGPSLSFDLKKPPKYENKVLGSEKTGSKKFTIPRHFIQNTVTHYNYYFNANNKLKEVMDRAKIAHREDYTQLLPFYNFSLQETAQYKSDLDSVIYKSTAGILIHDLRNDWIDNLYLLIGKAYYLRNTLDSAYMTFQYVNYTFSPKEKDGYDKVIGSNANAGGNVFSISTNEKQNIAKKVLSRPPSRNESLLWQIKTYLAMDALTEASSLIETLKNDPLFPDRLLAGLEEVQAYLFYKQQAWDSAAVHLEQALGNAVNKQEQARWEYLMAQLYERANKPVLAEKYYNATIHHTIDPVMEVYARLNSIRQNRNGDPKNVQNAIDELIRMGRKDRYLFYRDIIYYTAATIELERNNPEFARSLLKRSILTSTSNPIQKSKSFLALGDLDFSQKHYQEAKNAYDSVNIMYMLPDEAREMTTRKTALDKIVVQLAILDRQDSLHRIASMPEKDREVFIRNMVKRLRREQGISEKDVASGNNPFDTQNPAPADLFGNSNAKSSWPFSDASLKGKGASDFRSRWGNRPNVDNWRRQAAVSQAFDRANIPGMPGATMTAGGMMAPQASALTYEALLSNLPLTPEKQRAAADSIENSLFTVGKAYMNGLEDYYSTIDALEKLIHDYPTSAFQEEALFDLYYCYGKVGKAGNQLEVRKLLASKFGSGKYTAMLANPRASLSPDSAQKVKATRQYEDVYNMFIEGDFDKAVALKRKADSSYGQSYWTPQLLYIEGVYYVRQRADSTAKVVLNKILQLYPTSPMIQKTATLLSVLGRRREIEDYLTKLQITRPADDAVAVVDDYVPPKKVVPEPPKKDSVAVPEEPLKNATAAKIRNGNDKKITGPVSIKPGALRPDSLNVVSNKALIDSLKREESLAIARLEAAREAARKDSIAVARLEAARKDSIAVARLEAAREAARKDSIAMARIEAAREAARKDSIAIAKLEAARKDSLTIARLEAAREAARKDSIAIARMEAARETARKDSLAVVRLEAAREAARKDSIAVARLEAAREASRKDSIAVASLHAAREAARKDSLAAAAKAAEATAATLSAADSLKLAKARTKTNGVFSDDPLEAHYALFVLNKVDPVYVNEARNAFNRYHRERYNGQPLTVASVSVNDDIKLVVVKGFATAAAALDYIDKTKKLAQSEIVPWLTPQKYSFLTITGPNLDILQRNKDVSGYKAFLQSAYPGQF